MPAGLTYSDQTPSAVAAASTYAGAPVAGNSAGAEAGVGRIVVGAGEVDNIAVAVAVAVAGWRELRIPGEADTAAAAGAGGRWEGRGSQIFHWALRGCQ